MHCRGKHREYWREKRKDREHSEELCIDRIVLNQIFNQMGGCRLELTGSVQGLTLGPCEQGHDLSGSTDGGKFD
jgi:hypothetical protein